MIVLPLISTSLKSFQSNSGAVTPYPAKINSEFSMAAVSATRFVHATTSSRHRKVVFLPPPVTTSGLVLAAVIPTRGRS